MVLLGGVDSRIEVDQGIAGAYLLPVADIDGADDACLEGLDGLGAPGGDDLAGRNRHDIDFAEAGPEKGERKDRNHRPDDGAADGRRRRVGDLERRRQEGEFGPGPFRWRRQDDDIIRPRLHKDLPGWCAALRSGRRF